MPHTGVESPADPLADPASLERVVPVIQGGAMVKAATAAAASSTK